MIREENVTIPVGDGVTLEGALAVPTASTVGVVVAHPHPLYGGDMENPVVIRVAEVCRDSGLATLRFNFRGVGRSTGIHDGARGEQADVEAALAHLAKTLQGERRTALAGYSFGAAISAAVAARHPGLAGLALVAPPLGVAGFERLPSLHGIAGPVLIVGASDDEYLPREALDRLRQEYPAATIHVIESANHFFLGRLYPLGEAVAEWAGRVAGSRARRAGDGTGSPSPPTG